MKTLIAIVLLATSAFATNYTVKAGGGGSFTTIQACATAMVNGDTCTVFAGTYNENVTVPAGGVASYKTLTVNGSDVVTVQSFVLNSHTKLIGNCSAPAAGGSCGFTITMPSAPSSRACVGLGTSATDVYITNNTITQCGNVQQVGANFTNAVSYIYIQGNTLSYACSTPATATTSKDCDSIYVTGDHILVENNDLSHYTLGYFNNASYGVVRNNTFHDQYETEGAGNAHTDFWFSEPGTSGFPTDYNLVEGNFHVNSFGPNAKGVLSQTDGCGTACFNLINRYNVTSREGGGPVSNNSVNPGWRHHVIYNNTRVDADYDTYNSGGGGIGDNSTSNGAQGTGAANAAELNSIFYYTNTAEGAFTGFNSYACDDTLGCVFGHNLLWCASPASCPTNTIHSHRYGVGDFTNDPGNIKANPLFRNYVSAGNLSNDYHLQGLSPALGAGTNLTTAVGAGVNSTSLTVADVSYFQDGYGLTAISPTVNVQPDWIRVGGANGPTVQIASWNLCSNVSCIDYGLNKITLASPISWANNDPVYLYKKSDGAVVLPQGQANPDLGALPNISAVLLSNNPTSVAFGNVQSGQTGTPATVTVSNVGSINATTITCALTGTNANQFTLSGACPSTLNFGSNFTQTVNCAPAAAGSFRANLTIQDTSSGAQSSTTLSCTGTTQAPNLVNAPTTIAFGNQNNGTTSASSAVLVTNNGTGLGTLTGCVLSDTTNYTITDPGNCPATLASNASFTQHITFNPTTSGLKNATYTVTYDSGATAVTTLSGTGVNPNVFSRLQVTPCGPKSFPSGTGATCAITATGAGNLIAVVIDTGVGFQPASITITDNQGNTYAPAVDGSANPIACLDANTGSKALMYYSANSTAGVTTLTITPATTGTLAVNTYTYSGPTMQDTAASGVLNSQAASATPVAPSVTIGSSQEVILANVGVQNSVSGIFAGSPFVNDSTLFGNGWASLITSSTGAYQAKWNATSGTYCSIAAAFSTQAPALNTPGALFPGLSVVGAQISH